MIAASDGVCIETLGCGVRAEKLRPLGADGAVTQHQAFSGACGDSQGREVLKRSSRNQEVWWNLPNFGVSSGV